MTFDSFLTIMQRVIVFFSVSGFLGFGGVGVSLNISGVIMVGLFCVVYLVSNGQEYRDHIYK